MYQLRRAVVYVTSSCQLGTAGFAPVLAGVPMGHVVVGNRLDLDCLLSKEGHNPINYKLIKLFALMKT